MHAGEQRPGRGAGFAPRQRPKSLHDVLGRRKMREQCIGLKHHADAAPARGKICVGFAIEPDRPVANDPSAVRRIESGNRAQCRRFSAPRRADKGQDLAGRNGKGKVERDRALLAELDLKTGFHGGDISHGAAPRAC